MIMLERSAEEERERLAGLDGEERMAQWQRWWEASKAAQAAVTEHAEATGQNRYEVEQAVKKAVRHPGPESAAT
ncbi:hypothetical protein BIV24_14700 [Streptomyces colonosanans]|uniref:Uncharacterized protein n=1 Tax=Streptomyces colonosanans TaxID=1428652 RepID=A0A1S2PEC1_9ACTN|nr:hypothetical protein BIV24_14700 [Streptomyces colonosanans]